MGAVVDSLIEQLDETKKAFDAADDVSIPSTVKEAVEEGWQLTVSGLAVDASLLQYPDENRGRDRQRVVRSGDVFKILSDFERQVVTELVQTPGTILWSIAQTILNIGLFIAGNIFDLADELIEAWRRKNWIGFFVKYGLKFWREFVVVVSAAQLVQMLERGMRVRDLYVFYAMKKALPQRTGKRYRRRKKTRK